MVFGVKIYNRKTKQFRTKDGRWNKTGKNYSTLGHAKTAINKWWGIADGTLYSDFLIYSDSGIEKVPCVDYIISVWEDKIAYSTYDQFERNNRKAELEEIKRHRDEYATEE